MSKWKRPVHRNQEHTPQPLTREELEARYGQVWGTRELAAQFVVTAIIGNQIIVRRKADNVVGRLTVQPQPRYYFDFKPSE